MVHDTMLQAGRAKLGGDNVWKLGQYLDIDIVHCRYGVADWRGGRS